MQFRHRSKRSSGRRGEPRQTPTWLPEIFDAGFQAVWIFSVRGITLYVVAMALAVMTAAAGKWLSGTYSTVQIVFFRVLFAFIPFLWIVGRDQRTSVLTKKPALQLLRGLCMLAGMCLFFLSLRYLPLADAEAAFATVPLFMVVLAVIFLRERLSRRTTTAVVLGLLGAWLMSRPTHESMRPEIVIPLVGAVFAAAAVVLTRQLARIDASSTTFCWGNAVVLLGAAGGLPIVWLTPTAMDLGVIIFMGVAGGLSTYCEIEACRYAPIRTLAPFDYTTLLWATMLGYALWGDLPDAWTWIGACAIVIGGLHVIAAAQGEKFRP